jgi:hypothetical protein
MSDFVIRKGDRLPELQATLTDEDGDAVNLTGLVVKFHMRPARGGAAKVDAAATLVTPASGIVKYAWAAIDTDTADRFVGEFEVAYGDGRKQTYPNPGYLSILITDELA